MSRQNLGLPLGKKMIIVVPVVYEIQPVEVKKNGDFSRFFRFASDWPNFWEILAN